MSSITEPEDMLQTLPVNHPQAGYTSPAKDTLVDTGKVPDPEQEAWDARIAAQEAEADAVAESEHTAQVGGIDQLPGGEDEAKSKTSTSKSSSSSSASS